MEILKFDMDVPYWCSFSDFSSLKMKLTYPFPPPTTMFGMILNSMDKPAIHTIYPMKYSDKEKNKIMKKLKTKTERIYLELFNNLSFAIVINNSGEKVEDYSNIHKTNRIDNIETKNIKKLIEDSNKKVNDEYIKDNIKQLSKYDFYLELTKNNSESDKYKEIICYMNQNHPQLLTDIKREWELQYKIFMGTQIRKQKIINPSYTIYIKSDDSTIDIQEIKKYLENPINPLYIGESDDFVNITNINIIDLEETDSKRIDSVISEVYPNSELVKIPYKLKYDKNENHQKIISILDGCLNEKIPCFSDGVNNIVFI